MFDAGDRMLSVAFLICFLIQTIALRELMKSLIKLQKTLEGF